MTAASVTNTAGASFNNAGALTLDNSSNSGTFTNTLGATTTNYGNLVNSGSMVNNGTFDNFNSLTNNGSVKNYGTWSDLGTPLNGSNITNNGTLTNYGNLTSLGFANNAGGTITNQVGATMQVTSFAENVGALTNNGSMTIGTLGSMGQNGTLTNNGTLTIQGDLAVAVSNNALVTNNGTLTLANGSQLYVLSSGMQGVLTNSGAISNNGGYLSVQGTLNNLAGSSFVQTSGTTRVDGTMNSVPAVQIQGGTLLGGGTINGNVNNSGGIVQPGITGYSPLTINGNYTQGSNGMLQIDLGGGAPYQYNMLDVNGLAALDGTVDFVAQSGFTPIAGDDFTFLFYGSLSGDFAHVDLTGWSCPTGDVCDLVYGADSVSLDILAAGNGGGTTPTPEPSSFVLLGAALLAMFAGSRLKRFSIANA
jgi:hypothetical protein